MGRAFEYRRAAKEKRWDKMSKVFPKLAKAITAADTLHTPRNRYLIISRGLSFNYRLPRVFNLPEVVFITLTH